MPPRSTGSTSRAQPPNGSRSSRRDDLVDVGTGVDEAAEGHVPGDPGEAVEPGDGATAERPRRRVRPAHGSIRATAHAAPNPLSIPTTVIPAAHDGVHGQQCGHPFEGGAVAGAGGHGHHRCRGDPPDQAGQRSLHAGHHHHGVGLGQLVGRGQQSVDAGHPAVGQQRRSEPEGHQGGLALAGHRQVRGPGGDHQRAGQPGCGRPPHHRRQLAAHLVGPGGPTGDRPGAPGMVGRAPGRPGPRRPGSGSPADADALPAGPSHGRREQLADDGRALVRPSCPGRRRPRAGPGGASGGGRPWRIPDRRREGDGGGARHRRECTPPNGHRPGGAAARVRP